MSEETLFDKILDGRIPAEVVYEDEAVLAFRDISPQAPVHALVIPRVKLARFAEADRALDEKNAAGFLHGIAKAARALGLEEGGYRVVINNGRDGGQTVDYVHAHILGGRAMHWPPG